MRSLLFPVSTRAMLAVIFAALAWSGRAAEPPAVSRAEPPVPPAPPVVPAVPAAVRAALEKLPKDAQPDELRLARNGALYVLLPNGVELILKEKRNAPVMAVQAWVRTGAIHEQEWLGAGLSHFCEHMLFKGTHRRPTGVLDQEIRGAGGDDNAYTTSEYTVYHVTGDAVGLWTAFDALSDMVMDATFPPEETKKEHEVVYKEIQANHDTPDWKLMDAWDRNFYQVHPYRIPVLGYADRFKTVTREEVFAYYQRRYVPQLTTFVVVGDFKTAEELPRMVQAVAPWPRRSVPEVSVTEEPPHVAPREVSVTHPLCKVPKFTLGFPSVSLRDPDLYALDVLASILGDGRSSRLYREVKDKQNLALEISAFNYTPRYAGEFAVSAAVEEEKLAAARAAVMAVLEAAKSDAPNTAELLRAKRKVQTAKIFGEMTASGLAGTLGSDWVTAGDLDFADTYVANIEKVTANDVLRVARQYLDPQRVTFVVLRPEEKAEAAAGETGRAVPGVDAHPDASWLKKDLGATLTASHLYAGLPVWELKLLSGAHVILRQDPSLPVVEVAAACLGGQCWEPAELAGAGNLLAEMLDRGTPTRTKAQIAAQVEDLGASLNTFGGRHTFGVRLRGMNRDLTALLELGADSLLHPSFAAAEFEHAKEEALAAIAEQDESVFVQNRKLLRPLLFGAHPYAREVLGTAESVARITPRDLQKLHSEWVRPPRISIAVVGDFEPGETLDQLARLFSWKPAAAGWQAPATPLAPLAKSQEAEKAQPGLENAVLTLAFPGAKVTDPDRDVLEAVSNLLAGLGGRLNQTIREEKGLAYDLGVYSETQLDGGALVFYVQTDADKVPACLEAFWTEIKKLRDAPVPEAELARIRQYLAGQDAIALQDEGELAARLAGSPLYAQDATEIFTRRERFLKLTAPQIQAAARKYLDLNKWVKAVVKPAEAAEKKP